MNRIRSGLPVAEALVTDDQREFWEAAAEGRLKLPRCARCATVIWYPRHLCPSCGSLDVTWFDATGRGTVYSYTIVHQGEGPYAAQTPYVVAYVELEEGPRVLTNLLGDRGGWFVGRAVRAVFDVPEGGGTPLLRFEVDGS